MLKVFIFLCVLASHIFSVGGFANPVKSPNGSDPFMITRATTIAGLKTATPKVVWTDSTASRNVSLSDNFCNDVQPRLLDAAMSGLQKSTGRLPRARGSCERRRGSCTASILTSLQLLRRWNERNFRQSAHHALRGSSNIIWDSTWSYASRIVIPNRDVWSIDPTDTELTARTNTSCIPAGMETHGGSTWLIFSASNCAGTGYELGQLTLTGTNPLSASSWTKYVNPIFTSGNGNNEPGHNGFFLSPSDPLMESAGNQIWIVFHASSSSPALCDGSRYTMVQQVQWHSDGTPLLGSPRALTDSIAEPV
ncbi:Arabinanase/levansucrase/invertase [Mycena latifolia]|nr:Arabinanase/levansucrase/invertase [Mycena latifolia]